MAVGLELLLVVGQVGIPVVAVAAAAHVLPALLELAAAVAAAEVGILVALLILKQVVAVAVLGYMAQALTALVVRLEAVVEAVVLAAVMEQPEAA
jgi:hypothetical protein